MQSWKMLGEDFLSPPPKKRAIFCYSHLLNTVLKEKGGGVLLNIKIP